jgi:hypothetical protein
VSYRPLSARDRPDDRFDALQPGLPGYLVEPVVRWAVNLLRDPGGYASEHALVALQINMRLEEPLAWHHGAPSALQDLVDRISDSEQQEFALDVVDYLVRCTSASEASHLAHILGGGGAEWEVTQNGDHYVLTKRAIGPLADIINELPHADRARSHLQTAWHSLMGRDPNPSTAYREAIRAIEAVGKPLISPNNSKSTLGTMIGELRTHNDCWSFVLEHADVNTVITMADAVWKGQLDRHGTDDHDIPLNVSHEEADAAFHIALAITRIFGARLLRRASND